MAHCHTEYLKLKEIVKLHVQEGFSDLFLKQIMRHACERALPILGERNILISED